MAHTGKIHFYPFLWCLLLVVAEAQNITKYHCIEKNFYFLLFPIIFVYSLFIKCFYLSIETLEIGLCRKLPLFPSSRNNRLTSRCIYFQSPSLAPHLTSGIWLFTYVYTYPCILVIFLLKSLLYHLLGYLVMFTSFSWLSLVIFAESQGNLS